MSFPEPVSIIQKEDKTNVWTISNCSSTWNVVTPEHIGKSTSLRIKQAKELHKPVFVWLHETLIPMEEWETTYKNK